VGDKAGLIPECTSGEFRDSAHLTLPGVQQALVEAILATGTPVVLVLVTGRPYAIPQLVDAAPAVVQAWLPGAEGAPALAEVLFGDVNPSGKLPITFPRHVGQVPIFYGHRPSGAKSFFYGPYVDESNEPLFPFGFGLSYTTFELSDLRLDRQSAEAGQTVAVRVDVTNTGALAGDEVVQFYVRNAAANVTRPLKELAGFCRVHLMPGERRTVTLDLAVNQLAFLDRDMRWVVEPGQVRVMAGTSSVDLPLAAGFEITGDVAEVGRQRVFASRCE
jgi:beta-glucosidase